MQKNLKTFNVDNSDLKRVIDSEFASKWFFTYSPKYSEFTTLIDNICTLKAENYDKFEHIVSTFIADAQKLPFTKF